MQALNRNTGLLATCLLFINNVSAHHGIHNFDMNKDIELNGVITDVEFINPHSWLYLDVKDGRGNVSTWRCEMRTATQLRRSGWSKDMFKTGMQVTVTGAPDRKKAHTCYLGSIIFEDGRRMDRFTRRKTASSGMHKRLARLANGAPNLSGDWAAELQMMTDPRGISGAFVPVSVAEKYRPGDVPEGTQAYPGSRGTRESYREGPLPVSGIWSDPVQMTEAGARAAADFDATQAESWRLSCEPTNIVYDFTFDRLVNRIIQHEDRIILKYGYMDVERTIWMNLDRHPDDLTSSYAGHSIGRWENDVLVVDTVGLKSGLFWRMSNVMFSDRVHIVERFSLGPEGNTLIRSYVAEDPLYFVGQFTGTDTLHLSDQPYQPYHCDDRTGFTAGQKETVEKDTPWWKFWE